MVHLIQTVELNNGNLIPSGTAWNLGLVPSRFQGSLILREWKEPPTCPASAKQGDRDHFFLLGLYGAIPG